MISIDKGHFILTFQNLYSVSIVNGYGSYSENHFNRELINIPKYKSIVSKDCEIAIIKNGKFETKNFIDCDDDIKGYVSADELADIIYKVKNYKED